ncbi:MAG: hypothetical protein DRR16_07760 [Candidatus Parabeggiatoa sp. nov. 3]|nr:MAG: hypothetical protein DRR00_16715 [Gammaproteobacteria bacterium]RKZ62562.1 MAG: hypothetical protein DRQ99_18535 [Gammaproteobacteria bacterium]RKZ87243.1 MAG: hypothetical protein DRR16_07760 [Gammaproteobacteria bacterium]
MVGNKNTLPTLHCSIGAGNKNTLPTLQFPKLIFTQKFLRAKTVFHAKVARNFCVSRRPAKLNVKKKLSLSPR